MLNFFNLALLTLLIISAFVVFQAYSIVQAVRISDSLMASTVPYEQHPTRPDMRILVMGDSTAVGVGADNNTESIAGRLCAQFPNADIVNLGVSGARLEDLLTQIKKLKEQHFSLLVLQIGANDITHFTPYSLIEKQLSEILAIANQISEKTILLTCGDVGRSRVFVWPVSAIISARTLGVRDIFMQEAAKTNTVSYIDLYRDRENDPFEKNLKKYYARDAFHLSGDGYEEWYRILKKKL